MVNPHLPPRRAPTLDETIKTLIEYGTTPEAEDLLAITQWVTQTHTAEPTELPNGTFGPCQQCDKPWPCPAWDETRDLTLSWLIHASTTAIHTSQENIRRST
jgi:hypothetical protein